MNGRWTFLGGVVAWGLVGFLPVVRARGAPVLDFSDLVSGPRGGNSDGSRGAVAGVDGAYVTVWGTGLGEQRGAGDSVAVGGAEGRVVYWGEAVPPFSPANLWEKQRREMVIFQVSHLAKEGAGEIVVTAGGEKSNGLEFVVREGRIFFVEAKAKERGDGTWGRPWGTIHEAIAGMKAGDIVYVGDGVEQAVEDAEHAAVNLGINGEKDRPCALVGYPGAVVKIGSDKLSFGFRNWRSGYGLTHDWTLAKLIVRAHSDATVLHTGFRVVGNFVTAPTGSSPSGAIEGDGNDLFVLGNEITGVGRAGADKLYHPIYISSERTDRGPRKATEMNREIGWNYLHDNNASDGINIYSEGRGAALMSGHKVHDNFILNQKGRAILVGECTVGENWVYNNVIVGAGLGPEPTVGDRAMSHVGVQFSAGVSDAMPATTIYFYHNTVYGCGWKKAVWGPTADGALALEHGERFNVVMENNVIVSTGEPYFAAGSGMPGAMAGHNVWFGAGKGPGWDLAGMEVDPGFVDAERGDVRLKRGSVIVGTAGDLRGAVLRDVENVLRGKAGTPGAYEGGGLREGDR